jgi:F-type H+-transporting ATPase subunit delta
MPFVSSGKRYAQAAFELALEKGTVQDWRTGLHQGAGIISDGRLMSMLENPKLSFEAKKAMLKESLGTMDPLVVNLIYLLISRGKLKILGDISKHYEGLLDQYHGIVHAEVLTAVPLNNEDRQRLSRQFAELVGHKVIIDSRVDPAIVGGFKAKIGDVLIDGSIRNALDSMKKGLAWAGR